MILPPFFGFSTKYNERYIYNTIHDYLSSDILTYTNPTNNLLVTYLNSDILTYNRIVSNTILLSYFTQDILSYQTSASTQSILSYVGCDVLCYELPPRKPDPIDNIYVRDKDSLGVLSWSLPNSNKSPITDYIIQYKQTGDPTWLLYNDGISTQRSTNIILINNNTYHFRIAAVNSIGTGDFSVSTSVTPSGGIDNDCDLVAYTNLDSTDRNFIIATGCYGIDSVYATDNVSTGILGGGAFSNYWQFPGTLITLINNPHIGLTTFPHMHIVQNQACSWCLMDTFTLSFWFKPNSGSPSSVQTLLSSSSDSGNDHSWKIYHHGNKIAFATGTKNNLSDIVAATGLAVSTSSFTHIAVCKSNNYLSLFLNGVEQDETYDTGTITVNTDYLIIGAYPYTGGYDYSTSDGWGLTTEGFSGGLDEIIVSRSSFYRGNFVPPSSARNISFSCENCILPE